MGFPRHVPANAIEDYLDGGPSSDVYLQYGRHFRECAECRARIREERLLRLLTRPTRGTANSKHVSDDDLAAFCDERLDQRAAQQVTHHLASCERCLQSFKDLHEALNPALLRPMSTRQLNSLLDAVGSKFKPQRIGQILVERLKNELRLTWEAVANVAAHTDRSDAFNLRLLDISANAFLSFDRSPKKMRPSQSLRARSFDIDMSRSPLPVAQEKDRARLSNSERASRKSGPTRKEAVVRIDLAEFELRVEVADPTPEGWPVTFKAVHRIEPLPLENLHLTVEAGDQSERKATNAHGEARFILPAYSAKAAITLETGEFLDSALLIDLVLPEK